MQKPRIVVIGSSNTDMVVRSPHLPRPGETVLGEQFLMNPGGKGANQAVAAAKLGAEVVFIAKVGADSLGKAAIAGYAELGIDTQYIQIDPENPSGVALIMVDEAGENAISVALGANANLKPKDIDLARKEIQAAAFVLLQLEVPLAVVEHSVALANEAGVKVVLNPAPAQALSDQLLSQVFILTPNETEAELLTGIAVQDESSAEEAAMVLAQKGVKQIIITLGKKGAYVYRSGVGILVPPPEVETVDTTAAGDTFNGALVCGLAEGMELMAAVRFANAAAGLSVTKMGAQASMPFRKALSI